MDFGGAPDDAVGPGVDPDALVVLDAVVHEGEDAGLGVGPDGGAGGCGKEQFWTLNSRLQ